MAQEQYDCSFNICQNDSLQILVKDRKSKRQFSNLFTKSQLAFLNIHYTVHELVTILTVAVNAKQNNLKHCKFLIKYKSNSSHTDTATLTAKNTLFSYKKGDKMVLLLHISDAQYTLKSHFKLNEIRKSEHKPVRNRSQTLSQSVTTNNPFSDIQKTLKIETNSHSERTRSRSEIGKIKIEKSERSRPRQSLDAQRSFRARKRSHSHTPKRCHKPKRYRKVRTKSDKKVRKHSYTIETIKYTKKSLKGQSISDLLDANSENKIEKLQVINDEKDCKIAQLLQEISVLKTENKNLFNKCKESKNKKSDKVWLKQKIERLQKHLSTKVIKEFGINFKQNSNDFKGAINVSFECLQKLVKEKDLIFAKYENLSSKWTLLKKESRDLKKSESVKNAVIVKHKNKLSDLRQQISDRDTQMSALRQNGQNLENRIRKMEKDFVNKQRECDTEIQRLHSDKVQLNVKLRNALQEMHESKADFDAQHKCNQDLQQRNRNLNGDVEKLKYVISETNLKSLELIHFIQKSKDVMLGLSYKSEESDVDSEGASVGGGSNDNFV